MKLLNICIDKMKSSPLLLSGWLFGLCVALMSTIEFDLPSFSMSQLFAAFPVIVAVFSALYFLVTIVKAIANNEERKVWQTSAIFAVFLALIFVVGITLVITG